MTKVKGPNGFAWDLDPVVASGLLGSSSGEYQLVEEEPQEAGGRSKTAPKRAPRKPEK